MVMLVASMLIIKVSRLRLVANSELIYGDSVINLTHVINEFSFGPYFPNIAQPLDYTYEVADDRKGVSYP